MSSRSAEQKLRTAFKLCAILIAIVVGEAIWILWLVGRPQLVKLGKPDLLPLLTRSADHNMIKSAYPSVDFTKIYPNLSPEEIDLLQRECFSVRSVYAPFVEFEPLPVRKHFVKISEAGYRLGRGEQPWPPREGDFVVFVFGGSTTFSYCLGDEETVVAALEEELSAVLPGQKVQCYNFGRGFYFSTQERLLFESLLQRGQIPDLAVFIDGLNDHYYADGKPALTEAFYKFMAPDLPLERRLKLATETEKTAASQAVLNRYQHNVRMTKATADAYHVATVFVGPPVPFLQYPRNVQTYPFQKPLSNHELCEWGYHRFEAAALKGEFGTNFVWCGDAFADATTAMYADGIHYSPAGAKALARAIVAGMGRQQLLPSPINVPSPK